MTDADSPLPPALRLAWWGTAWLRGEVVTDLMVDAVIGTDATQTISGLSALGLGGPDDAAETLVAGLARFRADRIDCVGAAFPVEGDLVGLGGPPGFNTAALEAGEAVLAASGPRDGIGLVPERVGAVLDWRAHPARRRQLPDVGEADRGLRDALRECADRLAALDVARWRPDVADALLNLRHGPEVHPPPGVPPRCADLARRGLQMRDLAEMAVTDDGAAVSAGEATARLDAVRPLARAARRALVAAGSPEVWPPG